MGRPLEAVCARCNNYRKTTDLGVIDGVPLCHGEWDRSPTCYEHTSAALAGLEAMPGHLVERFFNAPHQGLSGSPDVGASSSVDPDGIPTEGEPS